MKTFILCVVVTALVACEPTPAPSSQMEEWAKKIHETYPLCPKAQGRPSRVALDSIIDDPPAFEGRLVEIEGYYSGYFEHSAVYSTPEVGLYNKDFSTGLWVLAPDDSFDGKFVRITGVLTAKSKGHLGQWAGTLCATDIQESRALRPNNSFKPNPLRGSA